MIKTLLLAALVILSTALMPKKSVLTYMPPPPVSPPNFLFNTDIFYSAPQYSTPQYPALDDNFSVNDALFLSQMNAARDAMMPGVAGDIRRSLRSEMDNIIGAQTLKINSYDPIFNTKLPIIY